MHDLSERKYMGRKKEAVIIPVAPSVTEMDKDYARFIEKIKSTIKAQRISIVLKANSEMICLYWKIGKGILDKQEKDGWGAKVIDRISKDLKDAFPDMSGFSPRNLRNMKQFAECWPDFSIWQQVVANLPWRSNCILMSKLENQETRIWYAQKAIENG